MDVCPAHADDGSHGPVSCHLADDHSGQHWDERERAYWSIEITYADGG